MTAGRFIAVVGPSGVGKDSVMEAIAAAEPRITLARRVITRPSDAGGEAFDGVDSTAFAAKRDAGEFALWWAAHGLFYGIPADVDDVLASGRDVMANLSRSVLNDAQARFACFDVIALSARPEVLRARLEHRGREDAAEIERRLTRADYALPEGIHPMELDNSGALKGTVSRALEMLYPVSV